MKNTIIITVIAIVIFGAGGFIAGTKYQQSKQSTRQFGNGNFQGQRGNGTNGTGANRVGFQPINGEIISSDANSITVKLQDGSSKIAIIGKSTSINKISEGSNTDLTAGTKVMVIGTTNSDGSVTAQNIQINPIVRTFQGGGQPTGTK